MRGSGLFRGSLATALAAGACLLVAPAALAQTPAPAWTLTSISEPTNFAPGNSTGEDAYVITAVDSGGAPTDGSTITLTDTLPSGLTLDSAGASGQDGNGNTVTCSSGAPVTCTDADSTPLQPGQAVTITVPIDVEADAASSVTNDVTISGGGAPSVTTSEATTVSATAAAFDVQSFDSQATDSDGSTNTQAGSHPYELTTSVYTTTSLNSSGAVQPTGNMHDLNVNLPTGLIGNGTATPQCTYEELASANGCPTDSQVGIATLVLPGADDITVAVYNMVPPGTMPAQFEFLNSFVDTSIRTGSDYGVTSSSINISQTLPVIGVSLTLWGDPGDPSHDSMRCQYPQGGCSPPNPFGAGVEPLLTMPTACSGPLTTTVSVDSWQDSGDFQSASSTSEDADGNPVGLSGCDQLGFSPTISVQPETATADSPSGVSVALQMPQQGLTNPTGLAEANLEDATIALPAGLAISPPAADGLGACTEAEIGLDNANAPGCPDASEIGSVEIDSPLLPDPMTGDVYLAQQDDNPFGSLLAIYVSAEADGVLVKLAGEITANPTTGQLTTTFEQLPQLPFTSFELDFYGGSRAPLATPESCGTFTTTSSLTPWTGEAAATPSDSFTIDSGCASGFSPSFTAGVTNVQAGAFSPFVVSLTRADTDENISGLSVKLPDGLLAKLAGVEECTDAQLAAAAASSGTAEQANPSCPAGSQVGTAEVGLGAGSNPLFLPGKVYLTGPYKGAPYGLAVVVPAVAGPFDLGTVVVRQQLQIDPTTAQVTDVSDPLPTILDGIPLRIKRVDVDLNRPDFTVNPTSCDVMAVTGTLTSTLGISDPVSSRFQVGGCAALGFSPKLKMSLTGKGRTRSGDHPTLTATLTQKSGQANISRVQVALPLSLALDPNNTKNVCPYQTAEAVTTGPADCPASTLVGHATAVTPLLSEPLSGPVYLVQGLSFKNGVETHTLPTLLIPLRGQIALDLRAQTSVSNGKLVTTFPTIPDAHVSKFVLQISGGSKGILVITGRGQTICAKAPVATAHFGAHSGKVRSESPKLATPACRAGRRHTKRKRHK